MVDESVKRCECKMRIVIQVFKGGDSVVQSARVTMAHDEWEQSSSEIGASILEWFFQDRKQGRRCWRHLKSSSKVVIEPEKILSLKKSRICQNSKLVELKVLQFGTKNLCNPRFWEGKT